MIRESLSDRFLCNSILENVNMPVWNKSLANFLRIAYTYVSLALALFSGLVVVWAIGGE